MMPRPPRSTLFPYTTLFRSLAGPTPPTLTYTPLAGTEVIVTGMVWLVTTVVPDRSEEHTSELQSRGHLVCRLLLEKKKYKFKLNNAAGNTDKDRVMCTVELV